MSDAVPDKAAEPEAAPRGAAWPDFAQARAWPEAAAPTVALGHRRDGALVHVRVEPAALAAYRDLSVEAAMPEGARVVAWHESRGGTLLGGYVLEKRAGTWAGLELDADGALVLGDPARCLRCHDMAPTDHLFGVPAGAPPASSGPAPALGESTGVEPR
jgi:hypothetical protein